MPKKSQIRRGGEEVYVRVNVMISKRILENSKKAAEKGYPALYYSFSHYVTCALLRQNKDVMGE